MKIYEITNEDLYQQTLSDLDKPEKSNKKGNQGSSKDGFKAGWDQGQKVAQKMVRNPIVSTLKKIDRWANRSSK